MRVIHYLRSRHKQARGYLVIGRVSLARAQSRFRLERLQLIGHALLGLGGDLKSVLAIVSGEIPTNNHAVTHLGRVQNALDVLHQ